MSDATPDIELPGLTIRDAGRLMRAGKLSPVALTQAALARSAQTEPALHAYVVVTADDALAAARQAATELRAGQDRGPLHGIPIAVKDIIDMRGLPTRCGSRARGDAPPAAADAPVVARLREAGAVLIGKTVTQEFAAGVISTPARNAWDPTRIPGGSSGGSGAAVAAGTCLGALGSDTGGSIRIPASVNGVAGLKPTLGRVSTQGVYPLSWALDTVGPLARTVEDAALVFDAIADEGPGVATAAEPLPAGDLRGVRLGVARGYFFAPLQPAIGAAIEDALNTFRALGADVLDIEWREARAARAAAFVISRVETSAVHAAALPAIGERINPDLRLRIEAGMLVPANEYLRAARARAAVKHAVAALFAQHRLDALVTPTLPGTAVPADDLTVHYGAADAEPVTASYTRFTMPFNATGQPALSLLAGFGAAGLPIGLQLAGRPYAERDLCRIGHAYEQAAGWIARRPPL